MNKVFMDECVSSHANLLCVKVEKLSKLVVDFPCICAKYESLKTQTEPDNAFECAQYHSNCEIALKNMNTAENEIGQLKKELSECENNFKFKIEKLEKRYETITNLWKKATLISALTIGIIFSLRSEKIKRKIVCKFDYFMQKRKL